MSVSDLFVSNVNVCYCFNRLVGFVFDVMGVLLHKPCLTLFCPFIVSACWWAQCVCSDRANRSSVFGTYTLSRTPWWCSREHGGTTTARESVLHWFILVGQPTRTLCLPTEVVCTAITTLNDACAVVGRLVGSVTDCTAAGLRNRRAWWRMIDWKNLNPDIQWMCCWREGKSENSEQWP